MTDGRDAYAAMLRALFGARRAGIALELGRVQQALAALGHPHTQWPFCVHVAGTNGKGSTCAFVESILRAFGLRTGLFTSPHLSRFAERFRIAGEPASEADILRVYRQLTGVMDRVVDDLPLTFFERVTVMGLSLFAEADIDVAILEVGLGGRYDATNAVTAEVACVTGVAYDHQNYLGDDLRDIAAAKAGIFKPGKRAVIGRAGLPEAVPWLAYHATRAEVSAVTVIDAPVPVDWPLALLGSHQRDNAACALAIVEHLAALGALPTGAQVRDDLGQIVQPVRDGLARAVMPGRMEVLDENPRLLVDGAHNPHGARVLARALAGWPKPRALVLGVSSDKHVAGIAGALSEAFAGPEDWLFVTAADNPRSMPAAELRAALARVWPWSERVQSIADPRAAVEEARRRVGQGGAVIVAGSLFLVGEVREHVLGTPADPIALSDPP